MSVSYVKIHYGPYESFYTISHKPQKLAGLKGQLQRLGFRVDLNPVQYLNYCMIEMCDHEVFRCNIKNLQFNIPSEEDPICQRAVTAVVEASAKFVRTRSYLWSWSLIEDQIFVRNEYSPKDFWPFEVKLDLGLDYCKPTCTCEKGEKNTNK